MRELLESARWQDAVDITVVAILLYWIISLVKGTRAAQILFGLVVLLGLFYAAQQLELSTVHWLLNSLIGARGLVVVVLFQNEIRRALAEVGRSPFFSGFDPAGESQFYEELIRACVSLANRRVGALMVLERRTGLREFIEGGIQLDAGATKELLVSIFQHGSPIHDGAAMFQRGRLVAASCVLPLTLNPDVSRALGTRHRAALGITEVSDAIAIVVSEETGGISLASEGALERLDAGALRERLRVLMASPRGAGRRRKPTPGVSTSPTDEVVASSIREER